MIGQPGEQDHGDRNKINWCMGSGTAQCYGPASLWQTRESEVRWMGKGNLMPKFQVECIPFSLHTPLQICSSPVWAGNFVLNSTRNLMLEGDQMTPGAGHQDTYLLHCCPHALIQPQIHNRDAKAGWESSSLGENRTLFHLVQRRSFPPFSGSKHVGQGSSNKGQLHFLSWNSRVSQAI